MNKYIALLFVSISVANGLAANYSTEAAMSVQKDENTYKVDVRVLALVEQHGQLVEKLISNPRITSAPGVPATLQQGLKSSDGNYSNKENVTVDVSWPYPNESGTALCRVIIKRGDTVVSKSQFRLQIEGSGRKPLVVKAQDVDPKSVRIVEEKSQVLVLLKLNGKTKEEVRKMTNENSGNKVQVQDLHGHLMEGGIAFGSATAMEMAVNYESKGDAEQAVRILRGDAK